MTEKSVLDGSKTRRRQSLRSAPVPPATAPGYLNRWQNEMDGPNCGRGHQTIDAKKLPSTPFEHGREKPQRQEPRQKAQHHADERRHQRLDQQASRQGMRGKQLGQAVDLHRRRQNERESKAEILAESAPDATEQP